MNKAFELILERLEEKKCKNPIYDYEDRKNEILDDAKKIVQEVAEEYNCGWIPCSERLPEEGCVLVCEENGSISVEVVGGCHWVQHLYPKFDESKIIAWQRLPEPYKE